MKRIQIIYLILLLFTTPASIASGQIRRAERPMAKDVLVLYKAAVDEARAGGYEEAAESFKQVIRLCPDWAEAHNNLGCMYYKLARHAEASVVFRQAIRLRPDIAEAHTNLGSLLVDMGRYKEAVVSLEEAVRLQPGDNIAQCSLGNAYYGLKRYKEAVAAYERSVHLDPTFAMAHYNLGVAYFTLKKRGAALGRYAILKINNQELANKLHRLIYKDQLWSAAQK